MSAAKLTQKATGTAQANAEVECKPDNSDTSTNLQARINRLEAQGRIQSAIMNKICTEAERRWNRDFNGDGLIGELNLVKDGKKGRISIGAVLAIALCAVLALAIPVFARNVGTAGFDNATMGKAMVTTDDAGTATLEVDAVDTDSIDPGTLTSVESITFDDGQVIDTADTTNMTITLPNRALGRVTIVGGGTTNVAGDDVSLDVQGNDSATTNTTYLRINTDFTDVAPGTQDATVTIAIPVAGTLTTRQTIHATGITVAGALAATSYGGITEANLVDKSSAETVSGIWTHSGALLVTGVQTNSAVVTMTTNLNAGGIITGDAGLVSGLDVSGTTIGGITEANLVDKSAEETVSGIWTHSGALLVTGVQTNSAAVTFSDTMDVTGVTTLGATTLTITNVYWGAAADLGITKVTTNGLASVTNVYYWYNGVVTNHEVLP